MAKRVVIESRFPAVKAAAYETVALARQAWIDQGTDTANERLQSQAATRGYALSAVIEGEPIGHQSARIFVAAHSSKWGTDPWFMRFFEYGTAYIPAMPFIRPAARKANKTFVQVMGDDLDGRIRRRASVRRR